MLIAYRMGTPHQKIQKLILYLLNQFVRLPAQDAFHPILPQAPFPIQLLHLFFIFTMKSNHENTNFPNVLFFLFAFLLGKYTFFNKQIWFFEQCQDSSSPHKKQKMPISSKNSLFSGLKPKKIQLWKPFLFFDVKKWRNAVYFPYLYNIALVFTFGKNSLSWKKQTIT